VVKKIRYTGAGVFTRSGKRNSRLMGLELELESALNKYWYIPPTRTSEMLWCSVLLRAVDDSAFEWLDVRKLWLLRKRKSIDHGVWCNKLRAQALRAQRLRADARLWAEDNGTHEGSLYWICNVLGLPYTRVKRVLLVLNRRGERRYRRWLGYLRRIQETGGRLDA
jgi:hypothetical protein